MNLRKQLGGSLYLYILFAQHSPVPASLQERVPVAAGNTITDAELAERLEVRPSTIARWRAVLKGIGVLDWSIRPVGRVYWIGALTPPVHVMSASTEAATKSVGAGTEPLKAPPQISGNWIH